MSLPPYPTVPAPSTYASGPVYVSQLRSDLTNGVNFLANRPGFMAYNTAGPAITTGGSGQQVGLDTEQYDNWSGHDPLGSNPQYYYCQAAGWYLAEGYVPWSYATSTSVAFTTSLAAQTTGGLNIFSGDQLAYNDTHIPGTYGAELFELTRVGPPNTSGVDVVILYAQQNSGSSQNLNAAATNYPRLAVRWVAATSGTTSLSIPANPAWPSPPSYVTSTFMNTNVRNALRFLIYPPIFRGWYGAGTATLASQGSFPNATKIALDNTTVDNYSGWSSANNWYVAPVAGVYYVYTQMSVTSAGAVASYGCGVQVNAGTSTWGKNIRSPSNASGVNVGCAKRLRLNAGDTVALVGQQTSGSTLTLKGGATSGNKMIIVWESS